jgi:hypothetical protein
MTDMKQCTGRGAARAELATQKNFWESGKKRASAPGRHSLRHKKNMFLSFSVCTNLVELWLTVLVDSWKHALLRSFYHSRI